MHAVIAELSELSQRAQYALWAMTLAEWDEALFMPSGAAGSRAKLQGYLAEQQHEAAKNPRIGELLTEAATLALTPLERRVVTCVGVRYHEAIAAPPSLARECAEAETESLAAWAAAKKTGEFSLYRPHLERLLTLAKTRALAMNSAQDPFVTLYQSTEPDLPLDRARELLHGVRDLVVPYLKELARRKKPHTTILNQSFHHAEQVALSRQLMEKLGFDFTQGRLDAPKENPVHPTMSYLGDTRVTTRYSHGLWAGLASIVHETGHGLYEQGIDRSLPAPLNRYRSLSVHESQSLFWENSVLHHPHYLQFLHEFIASRLSFAGSAAAFTAAVYKVEPSPIRVNADLVTYPLHILLRLELEPLLLDGSLPVAELPGAWNEKMQSYLGITPRTDTDGCMQDVHWPHGMFGYFPTYALGAMMGAQLFAAADRSLGGVSDELRQGNTEPLLSWLRSSVHVHGASRTADEMLLAATGKPLHSDDYVASLVNRCEQALRS